jgi:hypothetical protein
MPDVETINKADAAFNDLRPTVLVDFEEVATTCAKVIEKASQSETLTDDNRDAIRRASFVMKSAGNSADDAEQATVDEELWGYVQKDAEGVDIGIAPPSMKIERLAKSWNAEPGNEDPQPEPVSAGQSETPAEKPERSRAIKSLVGMGDLNDEFTVEEHEEPPEED